MAFVHRFSPPQLVQSVALLAIVAGVATWSSLLLTPAESRTPQAPPQALAAQAQSPAQQWFSNQPLALDIKVTGLMASPAVRWRSSASTTRRRAASWWASAWPRACNWWPSRATGW